MIDVVVIGGGPAGMSAALVAGRGRNDVLLIDEEKPRNAVTNESHAFLTRDGITPEDFRKKGRRDLLKYPTITIQNERIASIARNKDGSFQLTTSSEDIIHTKNVVLATGLTETLPNVKDIENYYGSSIFSCPFCDGWEMKERPLIFITESNQAFHVVKLLKNWTDDLIVATNGLEVFDTEQKTLMKKNNIRLIGDKITQLNGTNGELQSVEFENGETILRTGGFCSTDLNNKLPFTQQLGIEVSEAGFITTDMMGRTNINGLYAAGEITGPSQLIVSASQGHMAGMGIIAQSSEENFKTI
ncbi:NAD(P)/FAD-dependent oxidoreductase [Aerococcaceae bacterium DSM 111021]|nr:NAD(P)/FAD-dependent oxidoreductase [Aerococcaceae bacterium DSM 111021]